MTVTELYPPPDPLEWLTPLGAPLTADEVDGLRSIAARSSAQVGEALDGQGRLLRVQVVELGGQLTAAVLELFAGRFEEEPAYALPVPDAARMLVTLQWVDHRRRRGLSPAGDERTTNPYIVRETTQGPSGQSTGEGHYTVDDAGQVWWYPVGC
jgi:hypothetical protein